MSELIKVGQIIGTFGIRGEVKLFPITSNVQRFSEPVEFIIGDNQIVTIKSFRQDKRILILKFNEFDNINQIEKYKGEYLYVASENLYELEEDEYFHHDIIGLEVFEDDLLVGKIIDIIENPANDIYIVETKKGKQFFLPAVKEFILNIDVNENRVNIKTIEGMINEI